MSAYDDRAFLGDEAQEGIRAALRDPKPVVGNGLQDYIREAIRNPRPPDDPRLLFEPNQIDFETNTYTAYVDLRSVVDDMVARIMTMEEAAREQVIVEYLRAHGWTVTKEES